MYNNHLIHYAIHLRQRGNVEQSRRYLFGLLTSPVTAGQSYLHIAWSYDKEGNEDRALAYYRLALAQRLDDEDRFEAEFGLACTTRCLGRLVEAEALFHRLMELYPQRSEIIPFYALCLTALNRPYHAIQLLLGLIIENPPTDAITHYQSSLRTYYCEIY